MYCISFRRKWLEIAWWLLAIPQLLYFSWNNFYWCWCSFPGLVIVSASTSRVFPERWTFSIGARWSDERRCILFIVVPGISIHILLHIFGYVVIAEGGNLSFSWCLILSNFQSKLVKIPYGDHDLVDYIHCGRGTKSRLTILIASL